MPVQSTAPDIQLKRPEIYFGEITDWPVYVKTKQKEFNYPEGEASNYSAYEGTGGIRMGGFFRQLLLAWTVGDLTKVPFSEDIYRRQCVADATQHSRAYRPHWLHF